MIRVMIADDHPPLRQGLRQQLRHEPDICVVAEAQDGPTLRAAVGRSSPHVLLLDIRMPSFDACEEVPRLKEKYPKMRILILTACDDGVNVRDMVKRRVDGYMVKDERMENYARAIREVHDGEGYYSNQVVSKALEQKDVDLSPREKQVLLMIALGNSSKSIGEKLSLAEKTVNTYVARVFDKLDAKNRTCAVSRAIKLNLIDVSELEWEDWD